MHISRCSLLRPDYNRKRTGPPDQLIPAQKAWTVLDLAVTDEFAETNSSMFKLMALNPTHTICGSLIYTTGGLVPGAKV